MHKGAKLGFAQSTRMELYVNSVRKYGAALIAALLLGSVIQTNVAQAGIKYTAAIPLIGLDLKEGVELGRSVSTIFGQGDPNNQETWLLCDTINDQVCTDATGIAGYVNWDTCTEASTVACVAGVWAVDSAGNKTQGQRVKNVPENDPRYKMKENASVNLPDSNGLGTVWKIPGVINSAGKDTYFVAVQNFVGSPKPAGTPIINTKLFLGSLNAGIFPVEEVTGNFSLREIVSRNGQKASWVNGWNGNGYAPDGSRCASTDLTICEAIREFPSGYRFGLTLRMGTKLAGWYHGRLFLPSIDTKDWKTGQEISVEAEPVKVPTLDFSVPSAEIPKKAQDIIYADRYWSKTGDGIREARINDPAFANQMVDLVSAFAPSYKDKATSTNSYWAFKAMNYGQNSADVQKCSDSTGNMAGLVTTNSLSYSPGPPTFDKTTQSLVYKVASPHFEANGSVASGSYDLSLRSDIARCLYGFSSAPIKAEISITSDDGEKKVATTIVNEKNGWLYLSAKGFTFSSPTINVKLSQEKVVVPTPTPTPSAVASVAPVAKKSVTITCVKGKTTKKVSGESPKCPTGYKKK